MCAAPSILPYTGLPRSVGVQVPSLRGISIPLLEPCPSLPNIPPSSMDSSRTARPSLHHIATEAAPKAGLQHSGAVRATGHRPSRSLEVPSQSVPLSASNILNSAVSDSFILPWSKESEPSHEPTLSPLPGLYISHSCRRNSGAVIAATSVLQLMPASPPLAPNLGPPSLVFDSSEDNVESEEEVDSEDVWDLVPYDISWGSAYDGYREGTLPGPDGKCVFLRSPTPLRYQRTGQACEKCRERKAKCSGTRPACARCLTRGLTCEYASDSKRARSEDVTKESKMCFAPADLHSVQSSPASLLTASNEGRVRRNTDCGSHAARVHALNRNVALRRRHSTIGLSDSALPIPRGLGCRAPREPRLSRRATRNNIGRGFLGALLDPLIAFPRDGAEDDDLCVPEGNRSSYVTVRQDTDSFAPQISLTSSELNAGVPVDAALELPYRQQFQCNEWGSQAISDSSVSRESSLVTRSFPFDNLEDQPTCAEILSPVSSDLRHSSAVYGTGYAYPMLDYESVQSGSEGVFDGCRAELYCDVPGSSRIGMVPGEDILWPSDAVTQTKVETAGFPLDMDQPQIAVLSHAPGFHRFDHCEDTMTWFSADDL